MIKRLSRWGILGVGVIVSIIVARGFIYEGRVASYAEALEAEIIPVEAEAEISAPANQPAMIVPASATTTTAAAAQPAPKHQLQFNPGFLAEWSAEDHFIDYMKVKAYPNDFRWTFIFQDKYWNTKQADEAGYIDRATGDLKRVPPGLVELHGPVMLFGYSAFASWYAGDWVLTFDGEAEARVDGAGVVVKSFQREGNGGRLVFTMAQSGAAPVRARFKNVTTPIRNLRLYRLRHQAQVEAGEIWNPDFIAYARHYDVIRTMVMQDMNDIPARSWSEIAIPTDPHFIHREPNLKPGLRPASGRYGIPYEYLLNLAAQTDTALWMHIPIQIGSTLHHGDIDGDTQKIFAHAQKNAREIVASHHWDEFARALAERIVASQYPKDKPLYIELGNEIWNYAWPFTLATRYSEGIAKGYQPDEGVRYGYGILSGRMIVAMEAALEGSGYRPVYVIAGQTAAPDTTRAAYRGLSAYLDSEGVDTKRYLAKTGIALTTYHGGAQAYQQALPVRPGETLAQVWEREIARDPERLKKLIHGRYVDGSAEILYGKAWLLAHWHAHQAIARTFGVAILGAYEGGSHDNPPAELVGSEIFMDWWTDYHWGPYGADVVRQINTAIIGEFPGVILSDFTTMGVIGDWRSPWHDGHYSKPTAMMRMWREFDRVE